jgi:aryl carrier-like protein
MQKGQHTGKIVVSMTPDSDISAVTKSRTTLQLRPDASYLLAGGVGGLGRAMSLWMIENGARNLIFLSRSAGKKERDRAFLHELENLGCSAQMLAGDVAKMSDVKNAVQGAKRPIAGIIQLSMVLSDDSLMRMTHEAWHTAVSPKVVGTLNLHEVSKEMDLDFFVLLSSLSGIVGLPGQANYASAGTFLDAFVQHRHSMSLPASVLDLGAVEDVGFVAETLGQLTKWRASAGFGIREQEMLDAMQLAMMRSVSESDRSPHGSAFVSSSQMALGLRSALPLADPSNRLSWKKDPRMAIYHNVSEMLQDSAGKDIEKDGLMKHFLRSAKGNPAILEEETGVEFLAQQIGKKLLHFQLRSEEDVDITCSLKTLGMDSLIAIEMRNWWRQTLDFDITILELLGAATMTELGEQCAKGLREKAATDDERMRTVLTNKVL